MAFTVSEFKSNVSKAGGGARPALYKIAFTARTTSFSLSTNESLLVKTAAIPPSTLAPLTVNYAGRAYKWTGLRTFDNWTTTVLNDESFSIRNKITQWMRDLSGQMDGLRDGQRGDPTLTGSTGYDDATATVTQLGTDGAAKQIYKFYNLWPTELAEIPVDWSSDMIEEYSITWAYDYWGHGEPAVTANVVNADA